MNPREIVLKYCNDVQNGSIKAGKYIKLAISHFLDIERGNTDYYVDWREVDNLYMLGSCLHHYEGAFAGQPFILSPWQLWVCACIFGVKSSETNYRRYRTAYIKVAKKNGKSLWCVLMLLYAIISDPNSPQGYFVANSREQARICFSMLCHLCSQLDPKQKDIRQLRSEVRIKPNDSFIKILSTDNKTVDGINAAVAICDEVENYTTNDIYENLVSSQASRKEGIILLIGTAGFDMQSWDYEQLLQSKRVLDGIVEDNTLFSAIYQMDEDDDWEDEGNWIKANPNMGESVDYNFLRDRATTAKASQSQYTGILTKNFNWYLDAPEVWIPNDILVRNTYKFDYEHFKKHRNEYIVFGGIDLAAVSDLTAVSLCFYHEKTGEFYFMSKAYLPASALEESPNKDKYRDWKRRGYLCVTEGNCTDYDYVLNDLMKWHRDFQISWVGYDKFNATQFVINATEAGLPLEEFQQNLLNFNQPTRQMEMLLRSGKAHIDDNPITRFCFANVVLKSDWNDNVKPIKNGGEKVYKIDVVISMLEALGMYLKYFNWTA